MSDDGPTGSITSPEDDHVDDDRGGWVDDWLRAGRRRWAAALLLLAAGVVTAAVSDGMMFARLRGAGRMEALMAATQLAPLLVDLTLTVAVAVFVCTGSRASRLLGALTALAGLWLLSTPFVLGVPLGELLDALGPDELSYLAAVALQAATVIALALPLRAASPRRSGALHARG